MAEYFTQLSFMLEKADDWNIEDVSDIILALEEQDLGYAPEWFRNQYKDEEEFETFVQENFQGNIGINHEMRDEGLWIYSLENPDLEVICYAIQIVLRHFKSSRKVTFSCSGSCSKPLLDEFGGTAFCITSETVDTMSTFGYFDQQLTTKL